MDHGFVFVKILTLTMNKLRTCSKSIDFPTMLVGGLGSMVEAEVSVID